MKPLFIYKPNPRLQICPRNTFSETNKQSHRWCFYRWIYLNIGDSPRNPGGLDFSGQIGPTFDSLSCRRSGVSRTLKFNINIAPENRPKWLFFRKLISQNHHFGYPCWFSGVYFLFSGCIQMKLDLMRTATKRGTSPLPQNT